LDYGSTFLEECSQLIWTRSALQSCIREPRKHKTTHKAQNRCYAKSDRNACDLHVNCTNSLEAGRRSADTNGVSMDPTKNQTENCSGDLSGRWN